MSEEDEMKKESYRKLLNKMRSIQSKNNNLKNKTDILKSELKNSFLVDNLLYNNNGFNEIEKNVDFLVSDVNSVISIIRKYT